MFKKYIYLLLVLLLSNVQTLPGQTAQKPYHWDWKQDGPWLGAAFGGTAAGLLIGRAKTDYTDAEITGLDKDNIIKVDRWAAGNYSESADRVSEFPFYGSFLTPFFLMLDNKVNKDAALVFGLYMESLSTTAALFTITAGLVDRPRPLVYSDEAPLSRKKRKNSKRSFYSGHVAATATALFFAAKVFSDYHPNSKLRPYLYSAAFTITASVSYLRLKAGKHFLSDIVFGYGLGAAVGYLIPELHKRKNEQIKILPSATRTPLGEVANGLAIRFDF